jgi:hypothetical protein
VAEQKVLEGLVEKELEIEGAGVGEAQDEARKTPLRPADLNPSEVGPVDLSLLRGEELEAYEGFGNPRPQTANPPSQLSDPPHISAVADHLKNPGGSKTRVLAQCLLNELLERSELCRSGTATAKPIRVEGSTHGVVVQAELCGNGPDFPVLGVIEPTDIGEKFCGYHHQLAISTHRL